MLALEYAKKHPEYISHVVIIGMPPHMKEDNQALAKRHWDEAICPERKAALEHNFQLMPDSKLNALPRNEWFLQMNLRNSPKAWYNPLFDSRPLWEGVEPNTDILDQMYLLFTQEVDITARLKNFHIPTFLAYGAFEYTVAPLESWSPIRHKFKNLTVRVFDKSAHSPQHEEAPLFDAELLRWLRI